MTTEDAITLVMSNDHAAHLQVKEAMRHDLGLAVDVINHSLTMIFQAHQDLGQLVQQVAERSHENAVLLAKLVAAIQQDAAPVTKHAVN